VHSQRKKDELVQMVASAAISAGISAGVGGIKGLMSKDASGGLFKEMGLEPTTWEKFKIGAQGRNPYTGRDFAHAFTTMDKRQLKAHRAANQAYSSNWGWGVKRFDPNQQISASRGAGGWSYKKGSWGRNDPDWQRGGYIDNIPALLTGGEFVMGSSAVRRHGSGFFNRLNSGGRIGYQEGGLVGDQGVVAGESTVNEQTNTSQKTDTNTTINITVNSSGGESSESTQGQPGTREKELAVKIRGAVLSVLKEEKRTGGVLRDVTGET